MAYASSETLLPLSSWAMAMGIDPFEFSQVGEGFPPSRSRNSCSEVFFQNPWQGNGSYLSREEVGLTIQRAEQALAQELGFWPAPKYIVGEHVQNPVNELFQSSWADEYIVKLNWKYIQAGGSLIRTVIALGAAVVVSDSDSDGVNDHFTITVPTTVTDRDMVRIYFTSTDRMGADLDETWRIHPVDITLIGGNAIIKGHLSLLVKPILMTAYDADVLDVSVASNFVSTVDVYKVYTDTTATLAQPSQGLVFYKDMNCLAPCEESYTAICLVPTDPVSSVVSLRPLISLWNPDRFIVNYVAGYPTVNGKMAFEMADIVAHLATAWLPVGRCGCERSNRIIDYWQDPPLTMDLKELLVGSDTLKNPFGVSRGAIYAYERVQMLRSTGIVLV